MTESSGKFINKKTPYESFDVYVPPKIFPKPPAVSLEKLYPFLEKANIALSELNSRIQIIPNTALFIFMYVRKEALLSSQIEGTQSSFSDLLLFENNEKPNIAIDDVEEVSNYVKAIQHGLNRMNKGFPLSLRLLKEIHQILLSGSRGCHMLPGEFRTSQNWIGGTRPGNALYVPPPPEYLQECLNDFEKHLHNDALSALIKAGFAHVQFESIHTFLDGNGRLGRLLIVLLL
jgi:Fic family protein